ncbi:MAG: tetratricopeptide repeat protein [Anaerolineales bacterium]|nr:tetratricopeptide repeat protein [Anaerolineales bacterium]
MLIAAAELLAEILASALLEHVLVTHFKDRKHNRAIASAISKALNDTVALFPGFESAIGDLDFLKRDRVVLEMRKLVHPTEQPNLDVLVEEWQKHVPSQTGGDPRLILSKFVATSINSLRSIPEVAEVLHQKESTQRLQTIDARIASVEGMLSNSATQETGRTDTRFDAQIDLCEQLRAEGRHRTAYEQLNRLEKAARDGRASSRVLYRVLTNLGICALELGNTADAESKLEAAYDLEPRNPRAQANLAYARLLQGNPGEAIRLADTVLAQQPVGTGAPSVRIQAMAKLNSYKGVEQLVEEKYLDDAKYVAAVGFVFANAGSHERTIHYLRRALALDPTDFGSKLLLAKTLIDQSVGTQAHFVFKPTLTKIEYPAEGPNQALRLIEDALLQARTGDNERRRHDALAARSGVKAMTGDLEEAKKDANGVLSEQPDHVVALRNRMFIAIDEDKFQEVVEYYRKLPLDEQQSEGVALAAANAFIELGQPRDAVEILDSVCGKKLPSDVSCVILTAHALILLGEREKATALRAGLAETGRGNPIVLEACAFIDHLLGDTEAMLSGLIEASKSASGAQHESICLRLAQWHLAQKQFAEAVTWFDRIGAERLLKSDHARAYVVSLYRNKQFDRAVDLARHAREDGLVELSLIELEAWMAEHLGDFNRALELDDLLISLEPREVKHLVNKARLAFRRGQREQAAKALEAIDVSVTTDAWQLMQVAELHSYVGNPELAARYAFLGRRYGFSDPEIHLAYVGLLFRLDDSLAALNPMSVTDDTAVLITSDQERRWIKILGLTTPDTQRSEFAPSSQLAAALLGHTVGNEVTLREGPLETLVYRIEEIQSIYVRALQETLESFSTLFPDHQGLHRFRVVDNDFTKFFAVVAAHGEFAQAAYRFYHDGALTLEQLARFMGRPQVDIQQGLAGFPEHRLYASQGSIEVQAREQHAAADAQSITLGLSSLISLGHLGLLPAVVKRYATVYVAQQVLDELQRTILEREALAEKGLRTIGYDAGRFFLDEVPAERAKEGIQRLAAVLESARSHLTVASVNPEYAQLLDSSGKEAGELGIVSLVTLLVAKQTGSTLCADDWRLRQYAWALHRTRSIWSANAISELHRSALISDVQHFQALTDLVRAHYYFTSVSADMLIWALKKSDYQLTAEVRDLFEALEGPDPQVEGVLDIVAAILKHIWSVSLLTFRRIALLQALLRSINKGRSAYFTLRLLASRLQSQFIVLPGQLDEVLAEMERWYGYRRRTSGSHLD